MRQKRQKIGELEELILLMVGILGNNAYGNSVVDDIEAHTGRKLTLSAVHAVLLRLEKKGLLKSWVGGETKERGGRRKRFFTLSQSGLETLDEIKQLRNKLWDIITEIS